jgi:exonuclease III
MIQESHIPTEHVAPYIQGYHSRHCGPTTREGGVLIYYRAILPVREAPTPPNLRTIAIVIDEVAIINIYAPVNCAEETDREEFF